MSIQLDEMQKQRNDVTDREKHDLKLFRYLITQMTRYLS